MLTRAYALCCHIGVLFLKKSKLLFLIQQVSSLRMELNGSTRNRYKGESVTCAN